MLTPSVVVTDRYLEQSLESAARKVGVVRVTSQQTNFVNTKREYTVINRVMLDGGESP